MDEPHTNCNRNSFKWLILINTLCITYKKFQLRPSGGNYSNGDDYLLTPIYLLQFVWNHIMQKFTAMGELLGAIHILSFLISIWHMDTYLANWYLALSDFFSFKVVRHHLDFSSGSIDKIFMQLDLFSPVHRIGQFDIIYN